MQSYSPRGFIAVINEMWGQVAHELLPAVFPLGVAESRHFKHLR